MLLSLKKNPGFELKKLSHQMSKTHGFGFQSVKTRETRTVTPNPLANYQLKALDTASVDSTRVKGPCSQKQSTGVTNSIVGKSTSVGRHREKLSEYKLKLINH